MRMHGHGAHDDARYVPAELLDEWRRADPIARYAARLRADGIDVDAVEAEVDGRRSTPRSRQALAAPMPDPATATRGVFCDGEPEALGDGAAPWSGYRAATSLAA